jgi:citrate lyase subunit beta-like protein
LSSKSPFRRYTHSSKKLFPRRVLFNVPGSDLGKLAKATTLDLDSVVLDFEDGVALSQKDVARVRIPEAIRASKFGRAEVCVRVNSRASGLQEEDLKALRPCLGQLNAIVVPKVEEIEDIHFLDNFLVWNSPLERNHGVKLLVAIESAKGMLNLRQICLSSPNIAALIFASEDYCADIGATRTDTFQELHFARARIVNYAVAYGLQAIDMVCVKYKDTQQLIAECVDGFNMGFSGKQAIHPAQIPVIYQHFRPSDEKIEFAKKIITEMAQKQNEQVGAFAIDDKMIDQPMALWAQKTLAKANIQLE